MHPPALNVFALNRFGAFITIEVIISPIEVTFYPMDVRTYNTRTVRPFLYFACAIDASSEDASVIRAYVVYGITTGPGIRREASITQARQVWHCSLLVLVLALCGPSVLSA